MFSEWNRHWQESVLTSSLPEQAAIDFLNALRTSLKRDARVPSSDRRMSYLLTHWLGGMPRTEVSAANPERVSGDRLHPTIGDRNYLHLARLSEIIAATLREELQGSIPRVLDLGCGAKPYAPLFQSKAASYVGVDVQNSSAADVLSAGEQLPFRNGSFDVVLCTQVLEHDPEPQRTVMEAHRVLAEGGLLILSTHGVWFKHGEADYWRWTDAGLRRVVQPFRDVKIHNCGGQYSALFQILNLYADPLPVGRKAIYFLNNLLGVAFDRVFPAQNLIVNYVVVARK